MLIDHRFQRVLFAQRGRVFGAQSIEVTLGVFLFPAFALDLVARAVDALAQRAHRLADGFELKGDLATLAAKPFHIKLGCGHLALQARGFAVERCHVLFRLDNLVAHLRRR